jgi:hypothetical protein
VNRPGMSGDSDGDCKFFGVTPEEEGDTCDRCD